ncbi:MAG: MaoC family dehydratase N-terminal domain-containing protein [Deltaproteobacteria bacterium]|nr:MaoC family dehydratase N-terminal domain-containing protein [Deltaproteobacteria bacterium]
MRAIADALLAYEADFGPVTVTAEMIASYARAVGDAATVAGPLTEAPPTFCLTLRGGPGPGIPLPPTMFSLYGGHEIELHRPIFTGGRYWVHERVADVYEKSGRSGSLVVVVRESTIRDESGELVVRVVDRQIVRERSGAGGAAG